MVFTLLYKRPAHVPDNRDSVTSETKQVSINESITSGCSCTKNGIPEALSFEHIVDGGACPPCSLRDFMNYLKYVEFSAENLQFFLWYRAYNAKWAQLSDHEKALSPEWTKADANAAAASTFPKTGVTVTKLSKEGDSDSDDNVGAENKANPVQSSPKSPSHLGKSWSESSSIDDDATTVANTHVSEKGAESAFEGAGMKLMPFSVQPYRSEITRIVATYLAQDSPRELNLSGRERRAVLQALQKTTHPSAFSAIVTSVEYSLRKQAHPNFIRWTICNGNPVRVLFAHGLGVFGIAAGLLADVLITLSHASRPWRILPGIAWFFGIATLFAAWKGMCVVLHGLHNRHLRPWELFEDNGDGDERPSWDSLTTTSSNSFEDEPWVRQYEKRNVIRKIFDREVWIDEPALRQIQDTIFLQAILTSFAVTCIVVGVFCAVPAGNLY